MLHVMFLNTVFFLNIELKCCLKYRTNVIQMFCVCLDDDVYASEGAQNGHS